MSTTCPKIVKDLIDSSMFRNLTFASRGVDDAQELRKAYDDNAKITSHGRTTGLTAHMQHTASIPLAAVWIFEQFWPEALYEKKAHQAMLREFPQFRVGGTVRVG